MGESGDNVMPLGEGDGSNPVAAKKNQENQAKQLFLNGSGGHSVCRGA